MDVEKLKQMAGGGSGRLGGKGTVRRKKKAVHKAASTDDKRLQSTLKRIGVNTIPGIEEVAIYQGESVIQFANPKVQASIAANTYVVSGPSQTRNVAELMPANLQQMLAQMGGMGPEGLAQLQKLMRQAQPGGEAAAEGDDDDVPDLVENFEEAAKVDA